MRKRHLEPALQNIPIRTELGQRMRDAFIPKVQPIECDYASLELRMLAQFGDNPYGKDAED